MKQFRDSRYWVGEDGKVFSYRKLRKRIARSTYKGKLYQNEYDVPEKWRQLKPQKTGSYRSISLYFGDGKESKKIIDIHRLVAELYCSGYFEGAHVDHIDNDKTNNHYTNLQWCSTTYNIHKGSNTTFPPYSEWSK